MVRIGITGNIGSGKTTVCKLFEKKGIPVYYADQRAKELMTSSEELRQKIIDAFGKSIYTKGGLDRAKLGTIVFNDKMALQQLNELVHPVVFQDVKAWFSEKEQAGIPIAIEEAALTFEAAHQKYFDLMICIVAPEHLLVKRVTQRDEITESDVLKRLSIQMPQREKALRSDIIILNDQKGSLIFQVENIIDRWDLPLGQDTQEHKETI